MSVLMFCVSTKTRPVPRTREKLPRIIAVFHLSSATRCSSASVTTSSACFRQSRAGHGLTSPSTAAHRVCCPRYHQTMVSRINRVLSQFPSHPASKEKGVWAFVLLCKLSRVCLGVLPLLSVEFSFAFDEKILFSVQKAQPLLRFLPSRMGCATVRRGTW